MMWLYGVGKRRELPASFLRECVDRARLSMLRGDDVGVFQRFWEWVSAAWEAGMNNRTRPYAWFSDSAVMSVAVSRMTLNAGERMKQKPPDHSLVRNEFTRLPCYIDMRRLQDQTGEQASVIDAIALSAG